MIRSKTNDIPKVVIDKYDLSDNFYNARGKKWNVSNLIQYCKENNLKSFDLPLAAINLSGMPWEDLNCIAHFIDHMKQALDTDLNFPIIIDSYGVVADGWHRIAKAIVNGHKTIKAVRLESMPTPSAIIT